MARRRPNPTGFGPNYYSDRELLVGILNAALISENLYYRVTDKRDIQRIYAGHWQRGAGAARWFATAYQAGGVRFLNGGLLELYSHDTMHDCVRYGVRIEFNHHVGWWEVLANATQSRNNNQEHIAAMPR